MPHEYYQRVGLRKPANLLIGGRCTLGVLIAAWMLASISLLGCSGHPKTIQDQLRLFVSSVSEQDFSHISGRDIVFSAMKGQFGFTEDCLGFAAKRCASSGRYNPEECIIRLDDPDYDDASPDKFLLTFECFSQTKVDWRHELVNILGPSSGVDADNEDAYVVRGGVLSVSVRSSVGQVVYRTPALTGDPLDFREDRTAPGLPPDSGAQFFLNKNNVALSSDNKAVTSAILVAKLEERLNPFGLPIQAEGINVWLSGPTVNEVGINIVYLNPQFEGQRRMNGLIVHFASRRDFDFDAMSERLRFILTGMGFVDSDTVLRMIVPTKVPTAHGGEIKRAGNYVVARDYEPDQKNAFRWCSFAILRRVLLPPDLVKNRALPL